MNCRFAWRKLVSELANFWLVVLPGMFWLTGLHAAAQPYGLESRPSVGPFLNGQLPANPGVSFPTLLSQTGVFVDVAALSPAPGLIPFDVNTPLWTDNAWKARWIAVPDGAQIQFSLTGPWVFPTGTVLVKHFELGVNDTNPSVRRRIETRLLVVATNGVVLGATYRWQPDQLDAVLLADALSENIVIQTATGTRKQRWSYPSPADCLSCHNVKAGVILGPKTAQLERSLTYPSTGIAANQLRTWMHIGLIANPPDEETLAAVPRMYGLAETAVPVEARARSYLDANCAHCHQPGGPARASFDARYLTPLAEQGLINARVAQSLDVWGARVVAPGDSERSMLLSRLSRLDSFKMPPLGRNATDTQAVEVVRAWIDGLPRDGGPYRLVATGAEWKFLDDDTTPDAAWKNPGFDDSTWSGGASELGFGDDDEMTVIGAISLLNTAYFRRTFNVVNASLYTNLLVRLLRDDGAAVYLNGAEVFRSNLPPGPLSHGTTALVDVDGDEEVNYLETPLPRELLVEGTNVLAVEVHQSSASGGDLSFDLELLGWVRPAALLAPPRLELSRMYPGGLVRLRLFGFDGQPYVIEGSGNLQNWSPRWTNAPSGGVRDFAEPLGATPSRFYRARLWP